jgi:hypothetical protein
MNRDDGRHPDEIAAAIERTRRDIDDTLTAIEHRLTPGQLLDQGLDYLRHSGGAQFAENLRDSVKENPLPVALVGVGLAWLMVSGKPGRNGSRDADTPTLGERTSDAAHRAAQATESVKDRVSETAHAARERAGQVRDSARLGLQRARQGYDHLLREQPLVLGTIGLAIGAIIASAAPRTRPEGKRTGDPGARPGERAEHAGDETFDDLQDVFTAPARGTAAPLDPRDQRHVGTVSSRGMAEPVQPRRAADEPSPSVSPVPADNAESAHNRSPIGSAWPS